MQLNANIYKPFNRSYYMQLNANKNEIEIKKVLVRKHDNLRFVVIPRKSSIEPGDYVLIQKISEEVENGSD